jgi:nucleoside-diphosphate-sugar epimerase
MKNSQPIITVLGASGNIGKIVVPYLAKKGYQIKAIGRSKPNFNLKNVNCVAVDYNSGDTLDKACENSDIVLVLVGLAYKTKVWQKNWLPLTKRILESCKVNNSRLVFFDNVYPYGLVDSKMKEETPYNANTKKGKVRQSMDEMINLAIDSGEISGVIARSADFYGPGITTSVLGERFFKMLIEKNKVEIFGNPNKIHNYTYLGDIAPALEAIINSDYVGTIHLPTQEAITGYEFKKILEKLTGKSLKISPMRQSTVFWLGFFMPILRELHEMMYQSENDYDFDSAKFEKLFPKVKTTTYEKGLQETLEYYI